MNILKHAALTAAFLSAVATATTAATYEIEWTGANGYSLSGQFAIDDILVGTGAVNEAQLNDLSFEVFLFGLSQGSVDFAALSSSIGFNFNFDTTSEQFLIGGSPSSNTGQSWNRFQSPVGFGTGTLGQEVSVGSGFNNSSILNTQSTLVATKVAAVPLQSSLLFLVAGIGVLGAFCQRRSFSRPNLDAC